MKIKLKTKVNGDFNKVFKAFDVTLFKYLLPPKSVAKLIHFGGSEVGDKVHIRFLFPYRADWISKITETNYSDDQHFFIDEGEQLPFGLQYWRHKHIVQKDKEGTLIIDDIEFNTGYKLYDLVIYLPLYFSFLPRIKLYKRFFKDF